MATLLLSQGVPMLVAGDEIGRSQGGNNNAYCQDSEISWIDWEGIGEEDRHFFNFVRHMVALRRRHIVFHRSHFFHKEFIPGTETRDITWLKPDGGELAAEDWGDPFTKCLGYLVRGEAGELHLTPMGEVQPDDSFYLAFNAFHEMVPWTLPAIEVDVTWRLVIDTASDNNVGAVGPVFVPGETYDVQPRSLVLFIRHLEPEPEVGVTAA
jgi:glycogen operon protein